MDLTLFQNTPGLLSPEQQGDINSNAIESMAAALLKAAAPSPYKHTTLSGHGEGLQAGITGRQQATDEALKHTLVAGQIRQQQTGQTLQALQLAAQYRSLGLQVPPQIQRILDAASGGAGTAGGGIAQLLAPQSAPAPAFPSINAGGGGAPMAPASAVSPAGATYPVPGTQNAPVSPAGNPGGTLGAIQGLPETDRWALIAGGPAGDIVKAAAAKNLETTPDQKNAAASGKASPFQYNADLEGAKTSPQERAAKAAGMTLPEYTANLAVRNALASAKGKRMAEAIEAGGKPARDTLNTLDIMGHAVERGGNNITTGPGADEWLKVKQFAKNLGFEPEGTTESEILKKMNIFLATEATKQISARPAMFEFQQNLKANPGLADSLDGTKALISILRQTTLQNIGLGKLAMDEKNAPNWGDIEERFYSDPKNAIRSPFTGQLIGSAASGGAPPGAAPSAAVAKASPVNVPTATDPKTGHTVRFIDGRWQ
jgi:hypothetical protein